MKTLSFHNLSVGRSPSQTLLELDSAQQGIVIPTGVHVLVAPNGYGKTTLLQTLGGILPPIKGEIKVDGSKLEAESSVLYVSEYLTFPKFIYPSEWIDFIAGNAGNSQDGLKPWIEEFGIGPRMNSYLGRMSQGERRKVTWLAAHVSTQLILCLDEPLDGLDLFGIRCARRMLEEWKKLGRTVIIVAHQVGELVDLADSVFLIRQKHLVNWQTEFESRAARFSADEFRDKVLKYYATGLG